MLTGKHASIDYGSGSISGYFSEDNIIVGDIVIEDQVNLEKISPRAKFIWKIKYHSIFCSYLS